jgi:hypothetical protein
MIPGADLIIACPHCEALAKVFSIMSGSPFGTIGWSDGYRDSPMMPAAPRIARCQSCTKAFWTGQAQSIGYLLPEQEGASRKPEWQAAPYLEPLDEAGLMQALAEGLGCSSELELELRVAIWWRGNDAFRRDDAPVGHATSPEAIANMESLIKLMHEGEEDLLLFRAEALRHLGRFDEMEETLGGVYCSDYWPAKSRLLELARAGDRKLRVLFTMELPAAEEGELTPQD